MNPVNATALYVSASRSVLQCDPRDPRALAELCKLLPFFRQSLSCLVCGKCVFLSFLIGFFNSLSHRPPEYAFWLCAGRDDTPPLWDSHQEHASVVFPHPNVPLPAYVLCARVRSISIVLIPEFGVDSHVLTSLAPPPLAVSCKRYCELPLLILDW